MNDLELENLRQSIIQKASRYSANPPEGYLAGYAPVNGGTAAGHPAPGVRAKRVRRVSALVEWMQGIAVKDIPGGLRWYVQPKAGDTFNFRIYRR